MSYKDLSVQKFQICLDGLGGGWKSVQHITNRHASYIFMKYTLVFDGHDLENKSQNE